MLLSDEQKAALHPVFFVSLGPLTFSFRLVPPDQSPSDLPDARSVFTNPILFPSPLGLSFPLLLTVRSLPQHSTASGGSVTPCGFSFPPPGFPSYHVCVLTSAQLHNRARVFISDLRYASPHIVLSTAPRLKYRENILWIRGWSCPFFISRT